MKPPQSTPGLVRIWFVRVDLGQIMITMVDCSRKWGRLTGPNGLDLTTNGVD